MRLPAFRWLIGTALFLACGLSFFDRQVLSVLAPTITADLRMDNVAYSWVVFAFILSYSVMFSVGGWLIDRLGTRRGLAISVAIWSVASLMHATAHSAFQLGIFRLLLGVGEGGCFPGAAKGVLEWFPRERASNRHGLRHLRWIRDWRGDRATGYRVDSSPRRLAGCVSRYGRHRSPVVAVLAAHLFESRAFAPGHGA